MSLYSRISCPGSVSHVRTCGAERGPHLMAGSITALGRHHIHSGGHCCHRPPSYMWGVLTNASWLSGGAIPWYTKERHHPPFRCFRAVGIRSSASGLGRARVLAGRAPLYGQPTAGARANASHDAFGVFLWLILVLPMVSEETADETSAQSENLPAYCGAGCCAAWLLRCRGEGAKAI